MQGIILHNEIRRQRTPRRSRTLPELSEDAADFWDQALAAIANGEYEQNDMSSRYGGNRRTYMDWGLTR